MGDATLPSRLIVVGNGAVGIACAVALQRRGVRVTMISPEPVMRGASWGNAGHIATEQVEPLASRAAIRSAPGRLFVHGGALSLPPASAAIWLPFLLRLAKASAPARFEAGKRALGGLLAEAMPAWRRLLASADASDLLREDGHIVVWESAGSAAAGRARWSAADIGTAKISAVPKVELATLRTLVRAPIADAIRFEGTGQITDLGDLGDRLATCFTRSGGATYNGEVVALADEGRTAVLTDGTRLSADGILVAAGAKSRRLLEGTGLCVPLIAERGYHVQSTDTEWPTAMPPVVFEDRSMIVTRFTSGLRVAGFVEFGDPHAPSDPRKPERLRRHIAELGVRFEQPISSWMGARPTLPDYLPAIGQSRKIPALRYAFGHQHLGITLAAVTAEAMATMVLGGPLSTDLSPFDLERFGVQN